MDSRVDCSEYFFVQIVPRRVLIVPHEMSVKNVAVSADCPIVNFYTAAATRQLGLRPVRLMVTAIYHALLYRLSILSRLSRMQNEPRDCLTPTRLPARICASLRSFKCGDSAARPAACSQSLSQLSITLRMLPIRSHALRKLHLLDFSLRSARDKSGVAFPRKPARIDSFII